MTSQDGRRTFGRIVRSLRERAGRSRPEFAAACHTSEPHLRNVENGHKSPGAALMRDLEKQLGTHGLLSDLAQCGETGVRRRIILQSLALMGAAIPDTDSGGGQVGRPQLEIVQSMTATLRGLDNAHGGTHATHSIVAYLQQVAQPMLDGTIAPAIRGPLLSSVAELTLLAGWSAFDAGVQGSARVHFGAALELAEAAGNAPLAAEAIIATSNQAAIIEDGPAAVESGQAAVDAAESIGDAALVGEARMALAHGYALLGDSPEVARLITAAQRDMDRADRPDAPEWISHVGGAWLDGRIAQCLHLVDDRPNAVEAAASAAAIERLPRGQVLNLGHTAMVYFAADEPEQASGYARQALDASVTVQSARVEDYMRRIEVAAARYEVPEAVELREALESR